MTDTFKKMTAKELKDLERLNEEAIQRRVDELENELRAAYQREADPIFFKWQRGEDTEQSWKDKIAEIKARYPQQLPPVEQP